MACAAARNPARPPLMFKKPDAYPGGVCAWVCVYVGTRSLTQHPRTALQSSISVVCPEQQMLYFLVAAYLPSRYSRHVSSPPNFSRGSPSKNCRQRANTAGRQTTAASATRQQRATRARGAARARGAGIRTGRPRPSDHRGRVGNTALACVRPYEGCRVPLLAQADDAVLR